MPRVAARRILLLAVGVGIVVDITVPGHQAGLNAVVVMVALLGAACVAAGRDGLGRYDRADAWLPAGAIWLAAMAVIRADSWLVEADLLFAAALAGGTIAALAGARITRGLVPRVLDAAGAVVAAALTGAISVVRPQEAVAGVEPAAPHDGGRSIRDRLRPWLPVYRGLLLATPILLVFALLFASADAVFAGLARDALRLPVSIDLEDLTGRAVVVLMVAWVAAGVFALGAGRLPLLIPGPSASPVPPARSLGAASAAELARGRGALGSTEAATVLVAVDALFAAFVVLQLAYLFGGHDTLAVAGMTYADYARRGFFELVAVAVLAGTLVVCLDLAVRWRSRAQLAAGVALLALTGVVLASALVRLRLYQDAYGWTELRFVVLVAIGWLAVALGLTAWLVATRRTRWTLHVLGILVLATVAGMSVVGPQSFVADRNLERALDPSLVPAGGRSGLDRAYLASLGDEAIPAVVASYDRLPAADRLGLDGFLRRRAADLRSDPTLQGWPSFNVTRERARAALSAWAASH
jgi:hypothetical protein